MGLDERLAARGTEEDSELAGTNQRSLGYPVCYGVHRRPMGGVYRLIV